MFGARFYSALMVCLAAFAMSACNTNDLNDGRNIDDALPFPVLPFCQAVDCADDTACTSTTAGVPDQVCSTASQTCQECAADSDCVALAGQFPEFENLEICRQVSGAQVCVCSSDEGCPEGQLCNAGLCIDCFTDADCADNAAGAFCVGNSCVECAADADCGDGEVCSDNACVTAECAADADCPADMPFCNEGFCVVCLEPLDCSESEVGPFCVDNTCVECNGDADCDGDSEACLDNVCTEVECLEASDCPAGNTCDDNVCTTDGIECTDNAGCAGNPNGQFCLVDADDPANNTCTCQTSADCVVAGRSTCYFGGFPNAYCGCTDAADCMAADLGSICQPANINRPNASGCACTAASECGEGSICGSTIPL
ncbi:MAG: hypothetical protein ACFB9M_10525 [Myxococcota bacterium]